MKEIKLTKDYIAVVDDEDYDFLNQHKWYTFQNHGINYAARNLWNKDTKKSKTILMHRVLIDSCYQIDHIDGNGLNNQKTNLRISTNQTNHYNQKVRTTSKTGFKGVSYCRVHKKYRAIIQVNKKQKYLGMFDSKELAAEAYNKAALKYYGEFARLNNIGDNK